MTYIFTPNLETGGSPKILENLHEATGHYNPEDFKFMSSFFRRIFRNFIRLFRSWFRFSRAVDCGMFRRETV